MSKQRAKGTAAETAVVGFLRANGFPFAERRALQGVNDKGDITGIPGVVVEVKNHSGVQALGEWQKECREEMANAGADIGVVWSKVRGTTDPGKWRVTMDGSVFVRLLAGWDGQVEDACRELRIPGYSELFRVDL